MRYPTVVVQPIDLAQPFWIQLQPSAASAGGPTVAELAGDVLQAFGVLVRAGGFGRIDAAAWQAPALRVQGGDFAIAFLSLPAAAPALRLLIRALQFRYFEQGLGLAARISGIPADPHSAQRLLSSPRELEVRHTAPPRVAAGEILWAGRRGTLHLEFEPGVPESIVDAFDAALRAWAKLAQGGFLTQAELEAWDEEEELGIELDYPAIGHDFADWSVDHYSVGAEAKDVLLNLIASFDWKGSRPLRVDFS